jgi:hypothetical protein
MRQHRVNSLETRIFSRTAGDFLSTVHHPGVNLGRSLLTKPIAGAIGTKERR